MKSFSELYTTLTKSGDEISKLVVEGEEKVIKGMARFYAPGYGMEYLKISFSDHSAMVLVPDEESVGYSQLGEMGQAEGLEDEDLGKEKLVFRGVEYKLDGEKQYQYAVQVYAGEPGKDIEGECRFWDYTSVDGKLMLSVGHLMDTGKRADVLVEKIDIAQVEVN